MGCLPDTDMIIEAQREVTAAHHNVREAIAAWEAIVAKVNPAALLLRAAERRLERAHALLRSALAVSDNGKA